MARSISPTGVLSQLLIHLMVPACTAEFSNKLYRKYLGGTGRSGPQGQTLCLRFQRPARTQRHRRYPRACCGAL